MDPASAELALQLMGFLFDEKVRNKRRRVPLHQLQPEMDLDEQALQRLVSRLRDDGLLRRLDDELEITDQGVREVEQGRRQPGRPTEHLPASIVNIINVGGQVQQGTEASTQSLPAASPNQGPEQPRARRIRQAIIGTAVALVVGVAASLIAQNISDRGNETPLRKAAFADGAGPEPCTEDTKRVDEQPLRSADGRFVGTVHLVYSHRCGMSWGRITRADAASPIPGVVVITMARPADQRRTEFTWDKPDQEVFGSMLSNIGSCVYAEVYLRLGTVETPHARTTCYRAEKGAGVPA